MKSLLSLWQKDEFHGVGDRGLLELPLTAFFASRRSSGKAIYKAMDWAVEQARNKTPIIGGFHSPLEQSVLKVMLTAHAPVVIVIARKLETARLSAIWCDSVKAGTVTVVSMEDTVQRLTAERAMRRNHWIAAHATQIVVAEALSEGGLALCLAQWTSEGHQVNNLLAA